MTKGMHGSMWIVAFCLIFIFTSISCSKTDPVTPPAESGYSEEALQKWAVWYTDQEVAVTTYMEQKADVTNVVLGRDFTDWNENIFLSTNGTRGFILNESHNIPSAGQDDELNVVAWTKKVGTDWTVQFAVIANGGTLYNQTAVEEPTTGDSIYPAVTAHH